MSVCGHCKKTASFLCGNCKVQLYCSEKCQTRDWATHQAVCIGPRAGEEVFTILIANLEKKIQVKNEAIKKFSEFSTIIELSGVQNGPYFEIRFKKGYFPTLGDVLPPDTELPGNTWSDIIDFLKLGSLVEDTAERDIQVWEKSAAVLENIISNINTNYHPALADETIGMQLGMNPPNMIGVRFVPGNFENFVLRLQEPMEIADSYQRFVDNVKQYINFIAANVPFDQWLWSPSDYMEMEDEQGRQRMLYATRTAAAKERERRQRV